MAAPQQAIDLLQRKTQLGTRQAEAYDLDKKAVRGTVDAKGLSREDLVEVINKWCAGLKDEHGNDVAGILKLLLDEVEAAGFEWHEVEKYREDVLRALAEGFAMRLEKEDADVARGMRVKNAG